MAITFSGIQSTVVAAASATVTTPTAPGGGALSSSNVIFAVVNLNDAVGLGSWVAGSGWTQVLYQDTTAAPNAHILWRQATASEPANYTLGAYSASSSILMAVLFSCAGINPTTPVQVSGAQDAGANTSTVTCPAVTPTTANAMLFYVGTSQGNNLTGSSTATAGGTELFDINSGAVATPKRVLAGYYEQLASGASTGTRTITLSQAGANEVGATLALNPASAMTEYVGMVPI